MLSKPVTTLLERLKYRETANVSSGMDELININRITERAGAFYEKIRYLVDYKEERHIRRSAIERILKRKIIFEGAEKNLGMLLIQELIAGGYLANNAIAERNATTIEKIIHKYKRLEQCWPESFRSLPRARRILVSLMGSEIESFFFPNKEDDLVAQAFYETIKDHIKIDVFVPNNFLNTQTLIACYRSLFDSDDESLFYVLWLVKNPDWPILDNDEKIKETALESQSVFDEINHHINNHFSFRLVPRFYNYSIYFSVVREVIRAYGLESERVLSDKHMLDRFVSDFLEKNYNKFYKKARGSAVRAIIYIFCTKILIAIALEVPYELYVLKQIGYLPIGINITVHPLLLMFTTFSVKPLGEANTQDILNGIHSVLFEGEIRPIKIKAKESDLLSFTFLVLYGIMFVIVFGIIITFLKELQFNIVSILLFLCFLALISYFSLRIRHSANKWKVRRDNDKMVALAFNLFTLPIIRAGKWLSRKFSSINIFVFILDFIIETPFKLLLHFSDAFVSFLKEKQEDAY